MCRSKIEWGIQHVRVWTFDRVSDKEGGDGEQNRGAVLRGVMVICLQRQVRRKKSDQAREITYMQCISRVGLPAHRR